MKGKIISLDEHPKLKPHQIKGVSFNLMTGEFINSKGKVVGSLDGGYWKYNIRSKTQTTDSDRARTVRIRRADVVYWYWMKDHPTEAMPENFAELNAKLELVVDHIGERNGEKRDTLNDCIMNLRIVSQAENSQNAPRQDRLDNPEFRKLVAQRYDADASVNQVARRYKIYAGFVQKCALEFGYKISPTRRSENYGILAAHKQFIIDKRAAGWSDYKIAEELGVSRSAILRFRKKHGIK